MGRRKPIKSLLNTLVLKPLRWALEEAWQTVVALGLLAGALVVGTLAARSLWLGIGAGVVLVALLVGLLVGVQRMARSDGERDTEGAG